GWIGLDRGDLHGVARGRQVGCGRLETRAGSRFLLRPQGHVRFAIEKVHTVLVELDPDRLVGPQPYPRLDTGNDDRIAEMDLGEGDVTGRLDSVDLRGHRARRLGLVQLDGRVP